MNVQEIEELASLLRDHPITEICLEQGQSRIHLRKGHCAATPLDGADARNGQDVSDELAGSAPPEPDADRYVTLASEMVGLFHYTTPPIVIGMHVKEGQIVGNVESLKLMNEVVAGAAGQIAEVIIKDGAPVDYGQPLFRLTPA